MSSQPQNRFTQFDTNELRRLVQGRKASAHKRSSKKKGNKYPNVERALPITKKKEIEAKAKAEPPKKIVCDTKKVPAPESLPQADQNLNSTIDIRQESPWKTFAKVYECKLAGEFLVARALVRPSRLVALREVDAQCRSAVLHILNIIHHPNIISFQQGFLYQDLLFLVHYDIPITLENIAACEAYLNETQLSVILVQVLDGLLCLEKHQIRHNGLILSNILVTQQGQIKIARLEECVQLNPEQIVNYCESLAAITMKLMQKYESKDAIGVDDTHRWPLSSPAVNFLSSLSSTGSLRHLRELA